MDSENKTLTISRLMAHVHISVVAYEAIYIPLKVGIRIRSPCFAPVKAVPHGGSQENLIRTKYRRSGLAALKAKLRINCIDETHLRVCMHTRLVHFVQWTDS